MWSAILVFLTPQSFNITKHLINTKKDTRYHYFILFYFYIVMLWVCKICTYGFEVKNLDIGMRKKKQQQKNWTSIPVNTNLMSSFSTFVIRMIQPHSFICIIWSFSFQLCGPIKMIIIIEMTFIVYILFRMSGNLSKLASNIVRLNWILSNIHTKLQWPTKRIFDRDLT